MAPSKIRSVFYPVMPVARYLRRFLVERIESLLESLRVQSEFLLRRNDLLFHRHDLLQQQLDGLEAHHVQLDQRASSLETKSDSAEAKLEALNSQLGPLHRRFDALNGEFHALREQVTLLNAETGPIHGQFCALSEQVAALNAQIGPLHDEFRALGEQVVGVLTAQGGQLDVHFRAVSEQLGVLNAQIDPVHGQFPLLSGQLRALNAQIGSLHGQVGAAAAELHEVGLRSRGLVPVDDGSLALRTYDGFVLIPRQDSLLLLMLLDAGPQGLEPGTRRVLIKLLGPGMTFIDVGAHVGLMTLPGARAVGATGKVLAIEPVPLTFELLAKGLMLNGLLQRVELRCHAAGADREKRKLFVSSVLGHSSLLRRDSEPITAEIEVEVIPLDDLVPAGQRVDLVKVDVEGTELAVLEGMTRIISDNPELAIIAEFGPSHLQASQTAPEQWFSAFRNRGFEPYVIDELSAECHHAELSKLASVESANILFVRHECPVLARLS
jgi:FkbM family methyltransferase